MIQKSHIVLILFLLGFLATPMLSYACGTASKKTEKSSCKKETSEKSNVEECCKNHQSENDKNDTDCDGKCANDLCSCPSSSCSAVLPNFFHVEIVVFYPNVESNQFNSFNDIFCLIGFYSIWIPPKIA